MRKLSLSMFLAFGMVAVHSAEVLVIKTNYNAMVLYYNPLVLRGGQTRSYRQTYGARDIDALCQDYIKVLKRASGGQVNWSVAYRFELSEFPPDNDPNVTFTTSNYHELAQVQHYDMWDHGKANYVSICQDPRLGIVPKVEAGQVDAVWVFPPNNTGFWETAMAGNGAFWANGGAYPEVVCSRKFILYGFGTDGGQGVGYMLENTGHMMEVIMRDRIASAWPAANQVFGYSTMDLTNPDRTATDWWLNDWSYFTCTDGMHWDKLLVAPGHSQAGLSHFPPTSAENYGWSDLRITFLPWEAENFLYLDGSWSVVNQTLVVSNAGAVIAKAMMNGTHNETDNRGSFRVPVAFTDFDVEIGITVLETNETAHAGITFRCSRYNDGLGRQDGYYVGLQPGRDRVQLYRLGPMGGHTLISELPCVLAPNTNYTVFLSTRGSIVRVRLDPRQTPILTWYDLEIGFGGIGLGAGNGAASFSHVNLTPMIENYAETWRGYPNLSRPPRRLTSAEWTGDGVAYTDMDYFYAWWYEHLPKNPGIHDVTNSSGEPLGGTLNSWWPYMFDINVFSTSYLPHDSTVVCPEPDITPPGIPFGLAGIGLSQDEIRIEWNEPADNVGVTRYEVYRNSSVAGRTAKRSFHDKNLTPGSSIQYAVRAFDGSGNASGLSQIIRVATGPAAQALRNANFEQGLSSVVFWRGGAFNPALDLLWEPAGQGRYGSRCVSITADSPNHAWWSQEISGLVPSGRYLLRAWIKGENIVVESGGEVGASIGQLGTWARSARLLTNSFDWTPVAVYLTADGAGRLSIACRLGHHGSLATGKAWFDDVQLEYVPVATQPFVLWGADPNWLGEPPSTIVDCVAISAGGAHALALHLDGLVIAWGDGSQGQTSAPWLWGCGKAIAAGANHSLALCHDGQILGWGNNSSGQLDEPMSATNGIALAAGGDFSMVLRGDGTVVAWGNNTGGQRDVPGDLNGVVQISAGREFAVALRTNGSLRAWGRYQTDSGAYASAFVPAGVSNVTSVACGHHHVVVLLSDGTVRAWGRNAEGQTNVPPGLNRIIQVAAGAQHSLALKENGTVACWGNTPVSPGSATNVFALAAGPGYTIALMNGRQPQTWGRVERVSSNGGMLQMAFDAPYGSTVFLLRRANVEAGDWSVDGGKVSDNCQFQFRPLTSGLRGFFRVKTQPW